MISVYLTTVVFKVLLFSFIGWLLFTLIKSIKKKKLYNATFFTLPIKPLLGIICFIGSELHNKLNNVLIIIIMLSMIIICEYFINFFIEKKFNIKMWDYSNEKYNQNGRISFQNILLYTIFFIFIALEFVVINSYFININDYNLYVLSMVILGILLLDLFFTFSTLYNSLSYLIKLKKLNKNNFNSYKKIENDEKIIAILESLAKEPRLVRKLSNIDTIDLENELNIIKQYLKENKPISIKKDYSKLKIFLYELIWVFVTGCILGYVVESMWCFVKHGYLESRQGLIYGPFNQIYGIGAILLTVVLREIEKRGNSWIFIVSALIGGIYEAIASYIQEMAFGTVSWYYPREYLGILNGRTNLIYMIFWGILGLFFIKKVYPRIKNFIDKIPRNIGIISAYLVLVFFIFNCIISGVAVIRWQKRIDSVNPVNKLDVFLDKNYSDEMLEEIYPNMVRKK